MKIAFKKKSLSQTLQVAGRRCSNWSHDPHHPHFFFVLSLYTLFPVNLKKIRKKNFSVHSQHANCGPVAVEWLPL